MDPDITVGCRHPMMLGCFNITGIVIRSSGRRAVLVELRLGIIGSTQMGDGNRSEALIGRQRIQSHPHGGFEIGMKICRSNHIERSKRRVESTLRIRRPHYRIVRRKWPTSSFKSNRGPWGTWSNAARNRSRDEWEGKVWVLLQALSQKR